MHCAIRVIITLTEGHSSSLYIETENTYLIHRFIEELDYVPSGMISASTVGIFYCIQWLHQRSKASVVVVALPIQAV